jgi:Zn-finger nucleic acid-binding protein
MHCPDCQEPLLIVEWNGIEVDVCANCGGCWLDDDELGLLLRGDIDPPGRWIGGGHRRGNRRCPHCRAQMTVGTLPGTSVEIDACPMGHGLWLDRDECGLVRADSADDPETRALAAHLSEVLGPSES